MLSKNTFLETRIWFIFFYRKWIRCARAAHAQYEKVYLLDFFCSSIQLYVLLSPYLCFISLLHLDVLGDDASIS